MISDESAERGDESYNINRSSFPVYERMRILVVVKRNGKSLAIILRQARDETAKVTRFNNDDGDGCELETKFTAAHDFD